MNDAVKKGNGIIYFPSIFSILRRLLFAGPSSRYRACLAAREALKEGGPADVLNLIPNRLFAPVLLVAS